MNLMYKTTMQFFDMDGIELGTPLVITTDCGAGSPPASNTADLGKGAVRRILVTGDADIWVDDFQVNP